MQTRTSPTRPLFLSPELQVSILVNSDPEVHEIAYQYGRNVGIAFQVTGLSSYTTGFRID